MILLGKQTSMGVWHIIESHVNGLESQVTLKLEFVYLCSERNRLRLERIQLISDIQLRKLPSTSVS